MKELEAKKNVVGQSDPNRRNFVTRLLGGAAIVPLIAAFSTDSKAGPTEVCMDDVGYVGPNLFTAFLSDPTGLTRVTGVATFEIVSPDDCVEDAKVAYKLKLSKGAVASSGVITVSGITVLHLPIGTPASIEPADCFNVCDFDEFLFDLASGKTLMILDVLVNGGVFEFVLEGKIVPAVNSQTISLEPLCEIVIAPG